MELREALAEIADVRIRMAEAELFRGYRALPVALSGLLAAGAAVAQPYLVADSAREPSAYCTLWIAVALISIGAAAVSMALRDRFGGVSQTREVTLFAIGQIAPSLAAGALVTGVVLRFAPEAVALLPGLWQMLFSLGLFASCRFLPRAVAFFYLATGVIVMAVCRGAWALHPWAMGLPFGVGELAAAAVLYWNLERGDEAP